MSDSLEFKIDWEQLNQGTPEEQSCFGMITIQSPETILTEGIDGFIHTLRNGPYASGYHLGEWLTWNFWKLVSEQRPNKPHHNWYLSHSIGTVGEGYAWPNIVIDSDGQYTCLKPHPSPSEPKHPIRYTSSTDIRITTQAFETAFDNFIQILLEKLSADNLRDTALHQLYRELREEREVEGASMFRRLEATLGLDPDDDHKHLVNPLLEDAPHAGFGAITELAAEFSNNGKVPSLHELNEQASKMGSSFNPSDRIDIPLASNSDTPPTLPWIIGQELAKQVRDSADLNGDPLSDTRLAELFGVSDEIFNQPSTGDFAYAISQQSGRRNPAHVVLRSKWREGRRFELARILGDSIWHQNEGCLLPATQVYSYRQKAQRAFSAELLCPFNSLMDYLGNDHSEQKKEDAARHFGTSELAINSILVNHGEMERDKLNKASRT